MLFMLEVAELFLPSQWCKAQKCHVDIIKNETLAYQSSLPLLSLRWVLCASGISPINPSGSFFL